MKYISTRGNSPAQTFCEILLGGLAPDGGLYLPESYPQFSDTDLAAMRGMNYSELAFTILSRFADDIPAADLRSIVNKTYTANVYCHTREGQNAEDITPTLKLEDGLYLLSLSNGPTLAFKDMAMQLLGNLFEYVLARTGREINILGATSGDTGSSAEYAMRGKKGIRVFMLSPHQKMSRFQTAQMFSLQDPNIHNIAVKGVFDDRQGSVQRPCLQGAAQDRRGQFDQLGARRGANRLLLQGLFRCHTQQRREGQLRRAVRQFRQCLRRPHRAHDGLADRQPGGCNQRKRRAGRVLPHWRLPSARRGAYLPY
jgi:threonine synthase